MIPSAPASRAVLDLRGTPCPVNFVRCRLAIEDLSPKDCLEVLLDIGEPEEIVMAGLKNEGHCVEVLHKQSTWVRLLVICGAR
ncbi:sulfurtransferase TusA family protein [Prochlorococcus sp. MIT 1307]|uniref:sulfurtransferase TusA family protein n=1 Tax=Prochlorococcus sp. MIT 1307 TaxID=3096219 RepID=UPI002A764273|nr:sulfurtransferase TusA family protein [Prochlorococcus sp. MIT 1307]